MSPGPCARLCWCRRHSWSVHSTKVPCPRSADSRADSLPVPSIAISPPRGSCTGQWSTPRWLWSDSNTWGRSARTP